MKAIKWAATTLSRVAKVGRVATQQVSYLGKVARVSTWTPYGLDSAPPAGKLALLLAILGNPDNQVALVGSPGEGPALAETEVALFHPPTGSKIHLLADGSVRVAAGDASLLLTAAGGITATPGSVPMTVDGDLVVTGNVTAASGTVTALNGTITGTTTLGAAVTSNGKDISDTHVHGGSPTAPTGAVSNTGTPV